MTTKEESEALFGVSGDYEAFKVLGVELDRETAEITKGDSLMLTAEVVAGIAVSDKDVIWESDNPEIATVTDGVITAVEVGETTIVAKLKADETIFAICSVTVKDKPVSGGNNNNNNNDSDEEKWKNPFEDVKDISKEAVDAFKWSVRENIIRGVSDREIAPKKLATRAEVATMIMRFCK